MTVELIQTISLVALILSGVLFLVAVALFFLFNIPKVFGEVSGSTAKKAIENIRQQNERTGNKAYKPSPVNAERGKITDRITPSGKLDYHVGNAGVAVGTSKLDTTELKREAEESMRQSQVSPETTLLEQPSAETTMLSSTSGETTVLNTDVNQTGTQPFAVEYEIGYTGSSEIIE